MATKKYSAGPNNKATWARGGARIKSTKPLIIPPTTDANVEILIAWIAFPLLVISYPSMDEAAEADVPGALSRMAENEPPYIPAAKQETSKINAVSGGNWNDTGIINAIAIGGLNPGIAPITSPTKTPSNIARRFATSNIFPR